MAKVKSPWNTISLHPLAGGLDTRSRPADLLAGTFRWRTNFDQSDEGKPQRSQGWTRPWKANVNPPFVNQDLHRRNVLPGQREPITMLFRSTDSVGRRRLFAASRSTLAWLNDLSTDTDAAPGDWKELLTGQGVNHIAGLTIEPPMFRAAELKDTVLFTNDVDEPMLYDIAGHSINQISELHTNIGLKSAKFVWQWAGSYILANTVEGGGYTRYSTRIRICDTNLPQSWVAGGGSLAAMQDLPYGDEIMGGGPMINGFYIYTRNGIWVLSVVNDATGNPGWTFTRAYTEPENQAGCLAYPNTLVSTGTEHWYMSRDGVYHWNPFMAEPVREDWMHRASGVIYKMPAYAFSGSPPLAPIGWYTPASRTLSFSWPAPGEANNSITLAARLDQKVATVIDHGFTAAVNLRFTPEVGLVDTEVANTLVASGADWCIKELGNGVFYREQADLVGGDPANDLPLVETYHNDGYFSILRGLFPCGFGDKEKAIRSVLLNHDTSIEPDTKVVMLRIGNAYSNQDANDLDNVCAVLWSDPMAQSLGCFDPKTISAMKAAGQRPSMPACEWDFLYQGRFLYFELMISNPDGTAPVGADSAWSNIDFSVRLVGA